MNSTNPNGETADLKGWLRNRLQGRESTNPPLDVRLDEAPYEAPLRWWKSGDDAVRLILKRAMLDLIDELPDWPMEGVDEFALLIEACELFESTDRLEALARSRRLVELPDAAAELLHWFAHRGRPLIPPGTPVHASLGRALRTQLGADAEPRTHSPRLGRMPQPVALAA